MTEKMRRDGARTREVLLSAALESFSRSGYEGTSLRQIERAAGVERGLVGHHFGTKLQLWSEVTDALFVSYFAELEYLRTALRDVSRRERVRAMYMAFARFNARNPQFFRILVIEGEAKTERSQRLAGHLRDAMAIFNEITGLPTEMSVREAIRTFQLLGAAGSLFALTAHSEPTFGPLMHESEFVDEFADSLAALALEERHGERETESFGHVKVRFLQASPEFATDVAET